MPRPNRSSLPSWLVCVAACLVSFGLVPRSASAQVPSPEQIEIFQGLPPDQQQAILESFNRGGNGATQTGRQRSDSKVDFPDSMRPRQRKRDRDEEDEEDDSRDATGLPREPRLKDENTVLLTLEVRRFERPPPEVEESQRRANEQNKGLQQPAIPGRQPGAQPAAQPGAAGQAEGQQPLQRSADEMNRLEDFRARVLRRNPYKLDKWGILNVAELGPIPLAGLTVEEATERLAAEVRLQDFIVRVMRLPLKPVGADALKPFGYDLFEGAPSTFAPATDVPVPAEYVVGPGDTLEVQFFGNAKGRHRLTVGRDGRITLPELGPIAVAGRRFEEVRNELESRVRDRMIGTQASLGLGELRSIRVLVLGDADTPGSYTVSGLSTITNALFVSGGVKKIGSLRNIELKRAGRTVTTLDLYDLLLKGDTRADVRLLPGDVIFVPPVGATVGLQGEVRRPAIYELKGETTAAELLQLAGGLTPEADAAAATLDRVGANRARITLDTNLTNATGRA
jgi:protein involved in polysaccharide export with SLBB domain